MLAALAHPKKVEASARPWQRSSQAKNGEANREQCCPGVASCPPKWGAQGLPAPELVALFDPYALLTLGASALGFVCVFSQVLFSSVSF